MINPIDKFKGCSKKQKTIIISCIVGTLLVGGVVRARNIAKARGDANAQKVLAELESTENTSGKNPYSEDSILMSMQDDLVSRYGSLPDGFVWDLDGSLLSLGDKNMSAEDVVYAFMRGLSTLDFSTVSRYSRGSTVFSSYSNFFDTNNKVTDYAEQFTRNMYKQCLLSLQVKGIESEAVFAENKKVFTVSVKMLDLTDKDFWRKDSETIFNNLYLYNNSEDDSTKSEMYLYDYILNYYKSAEAKLRDVNFDITVQRYPDLDSGWLVSIDGDIDNACKYKDGTVVAKYIRQVYNEDVLPEMLEAMRGE